MTVWQSRYRFRLDRPCPLDFFLFTNLTIMILSFKLFCASKYLKNTPSSTQVVHLFLQPLHIACATGNLEAVQMILAKPDLTSLNWRCEEYSYKDNLTFNCVKNSNFD